jgi:uncharacterized membrane protein
MAGFHVIAGASETLEHIQVRKISVSDLIDAFKRGVDDFMVQPPPGRPAPMRCRSCFRWSQALR